MDLLSKKCVPCEGNELPLTKGEAQKYLDEVADWELIEKSEGSKSLRIRKKFKFDKYMDGIEFVNKIAKLAQEEGHHPDLEVGYAKITVNLWTHAIGGLSENDFILAAKIDDMLAKSRI